ncbi:MAG: MarR family winged helix-turn-helix transcriptional regulator [Candidatus Promineifilaceae bacterium]|nr:MarR family winged helix-turn-helix transcriptional regulator [Candidatus Promineifilaceae bacterium]
MVSPTEASAKGKRRNKMIKVIEALDPDVDPQVVRLMDRLRHVALTLFRAGDSSLATAGLSYPKYHILMNLLFSEEGEGSGELHPSQLSERVGSSRNTISTLIGDLEEEGLVERNIDARDRRRINVGLTAAGRTLVRDHARRHLQAVAHCFSALEPDEMQELDQLLGKLSRSPGLREAKR